LIQSIAKEGSALSKAAALAEVAYNTGEAIAGLTANSENNPANAVTFGGAGTLQFVQGLIRILANVAKAKQIINSGNISSVGTSSSANLPRSISGRGITETRGTTNQIDQQFLISSAFKNMPPVIASWKEATEVGNKVRFKEALTTA